MQKKSGYSIILFDRYICSIDIYDLKTLKTDSNWPKVFWRLFQEPYFSQIWDTCRNISNNVNFHYGPNSGKINDQTFQ